MSEKTTYIAIFNDGSYVEKETFEEILILPEFLVLLKKYDFGKFGQGSYNFMFIDKENRPTTLKIGDFEIIDIRWWRRPIYLSFKIYDYTEKIAYDYQSKAIELKALREEIIPLLKTLNEVGSWKKYMAIKLEEENQLLKKENETLKNQVIALQKEIDDLKKS
jgi:hypothetical protein